MADESMPLSEREREILILVTTGATNQQVAQELVISVNTVKVHLRNIFSKIGVESRTEATMWAVQHGLIEVASRPAQEIGQEPGEVPAESAPRPEPISTAKRLFFIASTVLVMALVFLPPLLRVNPQAESAANSVFTDRGSGPGGGAPAQVSRWSSRAPMPTSRGRLAAAAVGGLIYAIGGDADGGITAVVEAFDPAQNVWQIRAAKPTAVSNIGAVAVDGLIYVPGGMLEDGRVTAVMEVYDPTEDTWSPRASLPTPLCAYAVAAVEGRIYVFGGWDGERYLDSVFIYDVRKDVWESGTPMSMARGFSAAGVIGDRIYVVGGFDGRQELSLCEEYDPTLEWRGGPPWRERAPMSLPRGGLAVATVGDGLFALGGGWKNYLAYNERYDYRSNAWFSFETPVTDQWRNLAVAAVDASLYTIGGWSGRYLNINQEYQALYRIILPMGRP